MPEGVSSLRHVGIIAKYNFLNYFRARRFYVMLAIVFLITGLLTAVIGYYRPPGLLKSPLGALAFYATGWGAFATFMVILSTAFFGGDAISGEFQNRTGYFLVPNPIRRSAVYVGKWIAALAASTIVLLIYALVITANGLFYFPGAGVPLEFLQSLAYAWVYLVATLSLAFAFSSLFKSSAISVLMSVILLLFVFNVVDTVTEAFVNMEPWFSITYGAQIIGTAFGQADLGRFGALYTPTVSEGLTILAVYFIVTGLVGLWLFERKEFTS
jgi:ABC-2 type transport system permease protein